MFIIKRISKASVATALVIVFMLLLLVLRLVTVSESTTAYCETVGKYSTAVEDEFSVADFLAQFSIEVDEATEQSVNITIPSEFNSVYENYNALQQSQGLDLTDYKGKEATIYTYDVTNSSTDDVKCHLVICENRIVAGDLCTSSLDGTMTALTDDTLK